MSLRFTWKHHTSAVHKYEDTQNQILISKVPDEHYFINVILDHWPESGNRKMQRSHSLVSYWSPNFLMLSTDSCITCYYIFIYNLFFLNILHPGYRVPPRLDSFEATITSFLLIQRQLFLFLYVTLTLKS